jgi:hypothetical protein
VSISNTVSTFLAPDRLEDENASWEFGELAASSIDLETYLNPNANQDLVWRIVANGPDWIEVVPGPHNLPLTSVAQVGDEYALVRAPLSTINPSDGWTSRQNVALRFHTSIPKEDVTVSLDDISVSTLAAWYDGLYPSTTNLVPNPGFELGEEYGLPTAWILAQDSGGYQLDGSTSHSGRYSLRAATPMHEDGLQPMAMAPIDHTVPYRLTGWIKTDLDPGHQAFLRIKWCRWRMTEDNVMGTADPLGSTESTKLEGENDWTAVVVQAIPPYGATHAVFQVVKTPGENDYAWFDDLYFDGLGTRQYELLHSQAGYHCQDSKQALLQTIPTSIGDPPPHSFALVETMTGNVVFSGAVQWLEPGSWGRAYGVADFSDFNPCAGTSNPPQDKAEYQLEVYRNGVQVLSSQPFLIGPKFYQQLARNTLSYFFAERCGYHVPGVHAACHTDDALYSDCSPFTGRKDVAGGWHDAGDYSKYSDLYGMAPPVMADLWHYLHPSWYTHPDTGLPDPLDEAVWGTELLLKMEELSTQIIPPVPTGLFHRSANRYWKLRPPDNPEEKERYLDRPAGGICPETTLYEHWSLVYSLARMSYEMLVSGDTVRSERYLEVAERAWDAGHNEAQFPERPWNDSPLRSLALDPRKLAADTYLWLRTGNVGYRQEAENLANEIMTALANGWAHARPIQILYIYKHNNWRPFEFLIALMDWADVCGDTAQQTAIVNAVTTAMNEVIGLCELSPFGHLMEYVDGTPRFNSPIGYTGGSYVTSYHIGVAMLAARAAVFLPDDSLASECLRIAEHHLQWVMGRNPRGVSYLPLEGPGHKIAATFNFYASLDAYEPNGLVPGGICHGMIYGNGELGSSNSWGYHTAAPRDFPIAYVAADYPVPSTMGSTEVWTKHAGHFLYACALLEHALEAAAQSN